MVPSENIPILQTSTRVSHRKRYRLLVTNQLDNDPKTYEEVMSDINSEKWLEAVRSDMNSMTSNKVWTLVDPPKGFKPIRCKWVYKRKLGADGEVTTLKVRLVGKGYTQRPGVDFEETYSPVAMAKSIQILLATSAYYDYEIWHMDVKMMFLNGFIEEEIYVDQPVDFISIREEQKVCCLHRSIYGLKQASRSWNIRFDEVIKSYDFVNNEFGPCIYKKVSGSSVVFLVLYVDDILLIGNDIKMLGDTKTWLSMQFSMMDLGDASYILGIKIYRDRSRRILGMTQASYIEQVKSIQYVVQCTMPDIAFALSVRSSDASFQPDIDDAKSQSGFVFKLNSGVVAWKSFKYDTTVDSTTEAEYITSSEAAKEAI
ncbi:Retrovirus-related Pol polyprotein from transposon RE1 [Sesamum angolense]|uniref:Retrovirus-related Pol polyprotein from transposon RE1 n=1 Tax=Sesamum angolense TaxID=2727404 RepID=A0AAE1W2R6_9LAMI|nr:Retrovirus-related Pol polyprotein from transposon RE1 [Sesamum angolense]